MFALGLRIAEHQALLPWLLLSSSLLCQTMLLQAMSTLLPGTRHRYDPAVTHVLLPSSFWGLPWPLVHCCQYLNDSATLCRNVGLVHLIAGFWGQVAKDYMSKECAC